MQRPSGLDEVHRGSWIDCLSYHWSNYNQLHLKVQSFIDDVVSHFIFLGLAIIALLAKLQGVVFLNYQNYERIVTCVTPSC